MHAESARRLGHDPPDNSDPLPFALPRLGVPLRARSLARRSAVRFLAAASDAFLARADRSAAVIFLAAALPPSFPYFPKPLRYSSASGGIRLLMILIIPW